MAQKHIDISILLLRYAAKSDSFIARFGNFGSSPKLAAPDRVELNLVARACSHAALPSKRSSARQRLRLRQRLHRGAIPNFILGPAVVLTS
jgi:hypothetical protein